MDVNKSLVIRPKVGKTIFWLAFYSFWLLVGLASFYALFLEQSGPSLFLLAYLAFLFIAALEVRKNFVLLIYPKRHALHIGPEGLFFRKASPRTLPWDEVGKVSTLSKFGKTLVKIQRPSSSPGSAEDGGISVRLSNLFKGKPVRSYLIDTTRLTLSADELKETIRAYAKAYNSPATRD